MADINNEAPLAAPWYASAVQVNGLIAIGAQLVSLLLRIVARYVEIEINDNDIQLLVADITQGVAIVFAGIAFVKRQTSPIQPLTLTKAGAEQKITEIIAAAQNPPTDAKGATT